VDSARLLVISVLSHASTTNRGSADSVFKTSLAGELQTLLSSSSTTNDGVFTVEMLRHFLERSIPCFNVEEVDDSEFDGQPAGVDDVVVPSDSAESDGVDVGVEEEGQVDGQEDDGETLGTDGVRENLGSVTDEKTGPSQVVEEVVDENNTKDGTTGVVVGVARGGVATGGDGPGHVGEEHTSGGDEEETATTEGLDEETDTGGGDGVEDGEDTVDDVLGGGVGVTNTVESLVQVV